MFGFDSCRPGPSETTMQSLDAALKKGLADLFTGRKVPVDYAFRSGLASAYRAGTIELPELDQVPGGDFPTAVGLWPAQDLVFQYENPRMPFGMVVVRLQLGLKHTTARLTAFMHDLLLGGWKAIAPHILVDGRYIEPERLDLRLDPRLVPTLADLQGQLWNAAGLVSVRFQELNKATRH